MKPNDSAAGSGGPGGQRLCCLVVSDFNAANFAALLGNDRRQPALRVESAPFGQAQRTLLDAGAECWRCRPDVVVAWTRPQAAAGAFGRLEGGESVAAGELLADVDAYCDALSAAAGRTGLLLAASWVGSPDVRAYGLLDMKPGAGAGDALLRMNLRLAERMARLANVHVLNAQKWIDRAGPGAFSEKMWHLAKAPYSTAVFREAVADVKAAVAAVRGEARKLIVLDLDDTLWGGIVGDVGWENLTLGGHDYLGEAFVDFQRALKSLARRGVLLAIVSKNDEALALEAIRRHPEMALREEDFAGWRINWGDKAGNIAELVAGLNMGLQSVVFIDDSPAERARVREALPEVLVPEWPADKTLYAGALLAMDCFNAASIGDEDRQRTAMYRSERRRDELRQEVGSVEAWLATLGVTVQARLLDRARLPRAAQLLNKTNQMNLSTRRMTEEELWRWAAASNRRFWTLDVSDRFGEYGLTGLLSVEEEGTTANIADFVLSCRVMGRGVESCMLGLAVDHARRRGLSRVTARFRATARNKPCRDFFEASGFAGGEDADQFVWHTERQFAAPAHVRLVDLSSGPSAAPA